MFTRQELIAELPRFTAAEMPPLEIVEYGHQDFQSPCSEQCVWAFRGDKRDFVGGLHFWVKTLQVQGWEGREVSFAQYAAAGRCEPIIKEAFNEFVADYCRSLVQPLPTFLMDTDGYQHGLRMYSDWNDVAAVAELAETYVALYWSTTA